MHNNLWKICVIGLSSLHFIVQPTNPFSLLLFIMYVVASYYICKHLLTKMLQESCYDLCSYIVGHLNYRAQKGFINI